MHLAHTMQFGSSLCNGTHVPAKAAPAVPRRRCRLPATEQAEQEHCRQSMEPTCMNQLTAWRVASLTAAAPFIADVGAAHAKGGEFGVLEGRAAALVHPIIMGGLFVASWYAAYHGWQWRRTRNLADTLRTMRPQTAAVHLAATNAVAAAEATGLLLDSNLAAVEMEHKQLVAGKHKDMHAILGHVILGCGIPTAVLGSVNAWMRTGKLFPGPHLFVGAGIAVLWALAASFVPAMSQGNQDARSLHIGCNVLAMLLFLWQIGTGLDIINQFILRYPWFTNIG